MKSIELSQKYHQYKSLVLILILVIFYLVGIVGLTSSFREDFLPLSFMNLLISFIVLLLALKNHSLRFYTFVVAGFSIGMVAEWIGVHTGLLFGNYIYGNNLGPILYGVPLIIGINWVMLTIISGSIAERFKIHWFLKAVLGTFLMLFLDLLIEPIAIISDYWTWSGDIPFSNFVGWFMIAFVIQLLYFSMKLGEQNTVATVLYILQFVFFLILNIVL
ncbi:carotenoid biosynthesis protein [Brumimicrobium aurantiacum]|uniref:Carotenoid biosynthesis protein n=1 Tax=Brumimicrobium aurantiacum TaxID=1737063 RepID=A0A3E1F2C1_9FLAO|nr:carotenoid biosynthesis protein [Brumimicrobium aurantiacum]RFC55857.1 carotenoid biosynthesis protein [Brumimicrobium aurantiacum]